MSLMPEQQKIIGTTIIQVVSSLDDTKKNLMLKLIPNNAKKIIGM